MNLNGWRQPKGGRWRLEMPQVEGMPPEPPDMSRFERVLVGASLLALAGALYWFTSWLPSGLLLGLPVLGTTLLARLLDAIPLAESTADRDARFPSPTIGQRVQNLGTGDIERFTASGWVGTGFAAAALLGTINPLAAPYNAKGDGVTDDTAVLRAAATAAGTDGIFLAGRTFLVSGTVTARKVIGAGRQSVIRLKNAAALDPFTNTGTEAVFPILTNPTHTGTQDTGLLFRDFRIEGNSAGQSHDQGMAGLFLRNVNGAEVVGVNIQDITPNSRITFGKQSFCLLALESTDVHVRGGKYTGAGYECVGFRNAVTHSSIEGVTTGDGAVHSIQVAAGADFGSPVTSPEYIAITGCTVKNHDARQNGSGIISHTANYVTITGNTVEVKDVNNVTITTGILLDTSTGCVVDGNIVRAAGHGLFIRNSVTNSRAADNYFQAFITGSTPAGQGMVFDVSSGTKPVDVELNHNTCKVAAGLNGIWVLHGTKIRLIDNTLIDGLRSIYVNGSGTNTTDITIAGNDCTPVSGAGGGGIIVAGNASNIRIWKRNVVRAANAIQSGIVVEGTAFDVRIKGDNDLSGVLTPANRIVITSSGAGIVVGSDEVAAQFATSADYTLTTDDRTVLVSASGAPRTMTLPAAAANRGRLYAVKKTDNSANTVTIDANAAETIDGALTKVLTAQHEVVTVQSDGANWHIIG